ncbi:hypothetical protein [Streptomyces sp. KL116D]|uniref:hypothetical protein n=1 Tax=Streptomyces sp. KL116D TaxID=3045152 RepID=UPI0035564F0B
MRRAVVLVALAVAALVGCGGAGTPDTVDGVPVLRDEGKLPELPLERYEFDGSDDKAYDRFDRAKSLLAQRCMVRLGFTDFPRDPKWPSMGNTSHGALVAVSTGPVGLLDLDTARHWGYGWNPRRKDTGLREPAGREMTYEESAAYSASSSEDVHRTAHGHEVPRGGCSGEADRRVLRGVQDLRRMWTYVAERDAAVDKRAAKDAQLRRALKTWSDCVVDRGFKRYADPAAAFSDKAWRRGDDGNSRRTERELGTATADVECKREHNTAGVWVSVADRLQRQELARHRSTFEAVRRDRDRVLDNVRKVLESA